MAGVLMLLLPLCSAKLGTFKQNNCVEIKTILNTTAVNISTVSYPNSTMDVINIVMTSNGKNFNYTFCKTTALGIYIYDYFDAGGNVYVNNFEITPNGAEISTGKGIIYFIFLIAGIFIFILCVYGAVTIPFKNQRNSDGEIISINDLKYVKVILMVISYLVFLFLVGLLRAITANYVYEIGVDKFFNYFYWILLSFIYPIFVCSLLFILILFLQGKKMKKALERGIPIE